MKYCSVEQIVGHKHYTNGFFNRKLLLLRWSVEVYVLCICIEMVLVLPFLWLGFAVGGDVVRSIGLAIFACGASSA